MNKTAGTIFIVIIVLAILGLAYYFIIYKKSNGNIIGSDTNYPDNGTDGSNGNSGNATPNVNPLPINITPGLGFHSTQVNESDTVPATNPATYFNNLTEDNVTSYNIQTSAQSPLTAIHYVTGFGSTCSPFVWYAGSLYVYAGTKTDGQGNKTCYYKFDKSIFPSQIKIQLRVDAQNCSQYHYFISGIEYTYKEIQISGGNLTSLPKRYCVYDKK